MSEKLGVDKLEIMFALQDGLQKRLGTWDKIKTDADRQQFTNQMILAVVEEAVEIMRETPYKNPEYMPFGWKKGQMYDRKKYISEVVDLFHFVMNLCLSHGFTADDFFNEYCRKNNINHERQQNGY